MLHHLQINISPATRKNQSIHGIFVSVWTMRAPMRSFLFGLYCCQWVIFMSGKNTPHTAWGTKFADRPLCVSLQKSHMSKVCATTAEYCLMWRRTRAMLKVWHLVVPPRRSEVQPAIYACQPGREM